jgi:hypothetical protein
VSSSTKFLKKKNPRKFSNSGDQGKPQYIRGSTKKKNSGDQGKPQYIRGSKKKGYAAPATNQ